jgi:hypothetical protein
MKGERDLDESGYLPFSVQLLQKDHCNGTYWCDQGELGTLQHITIMKQ